MANKKSTVRGIRITERLYKHLLRERGRVQMKKPDESVSIGAVAEELILGKRKK